MGYKFQMSEESNIYYTYVVRPAEAPEGRGIAFANAVVAQISYLLRLGVTLQLVGVLGVALVSLSSSSPLQLISIFAGSDNHKTDTPALSLLVFLTLWITGSLCISLYGLVADDDSSIKMSRGFRAGVKALNFAAFLDIVSVLASTSNFLGYVLVFEENWLTTYLNSGAYAIFFKYSRTAHAIAYAFYGFGYFCIEGFHIEGAGTVFAWALGYLKVLCCLLELLVLSEYPGTYASVLLELIYSGALILVHATTCLWGFLFEPMSLKYEVKLTQSAIRNEFFKSQNSVAYYGNNLNEGKIGGYDDNQAV